MTILDFLLSEIEIGVFTILIFNIILALLIIAAGFVFGRLVKYLLKKAADKTNLQRVIKLSFIDLFFTVIKWCIYLVFISIAIGQLGVPELINRLASLLVVAPAIVGSLIIIVVGFGIAVYLRDLIKETNVKEGKTIGLVLFYFIGYITIIFALEIALMILEKDVLNTIIIIFTAVFSAAIAYWHMKTSNISKNK